MARGALLKLSSAWPAYLLIVLLPFDVYAVDVLENVKLTPAFAFIIVFVPVFVLHLLFGGVRFLKTPVTGLFLFYLFVALLTVPITDDPGAAFVGWGAAGLLLVIFLYTTAYLDTPEKLERAITCFIVVGMVVAIMGLVEFFGYVVFGKQISPPLALRGQQFSYGFGGGLMRMHGFFSTSNKVGSYLMIPFGLAVYRLSKAVGNRYLYGACTLVLGATVVLTLARNAHLALIAFFTLWFLFRQKKDPAGSAVVTSMVMLVVMLILVLNPSTGVRFIDRMNPFGHNPGVADASLDLELLRGHLKTATVAGFQNLGLGRGIQNYDDWAYDTGEVIQWGAHSNFLHFLGETGILGFTTQAMLVIYLVSLSIRRWVRSGCTDGLALYLTCIYVGLVLAGVVRTYYFTEYTFVIIGMIIRNAQLHSKIFSSINGVELARPRKGHPPRLPDSAPPLGV